MFRHLPALLLIVTVGLTGLAPAAAHAGSTLGHACCRTVHAQPAPHHGCAGTAPAMRCCAPAPDRSSSSQVPPASASSSHLTPLKGNATLALPAPGPVDRSVAQAFEAARLKLPGDPLYLRHLVLLV